MLYRSSWARQSPETSLDNLCGSCNGACCRNMIVPLTPSEAQWHKGHGTDLRELPGLNRALTVPRGKEFFHMAGACGLLDTTTGLCTAYDERPEACREEVEPGDQLCTEARAKRLPAARPVPLPMPVARVDLQPVNS